MIRISDIPTGEDKESVYLRRQIIIDKLIPLIGKSFPCKAFGTRKVDMLFDSVDETATRGARRYESTLAALRVVEALRNAEIVGQSNPSSSKQKRMRFKKVYELHSSLKGIGDVKIIIGELGSKRVIHYCITKIRR